MVNRPSTSSSPHLQDKYNRDVEVATRALDTRVKSFETRINSLETQVGINTGDITDLTTELADLRLAYDAHIVEYIEYKEVTAETLEDHADRITFLEDA